MESKILTILLVFPTLGGCSTTYVKRMTYEVLRQEDCRRNQLEDFCSRGFTFEYQEYERLRKDFIAGQTVQSDWRMSEPHGEYSN